jgi:hypothetical protein
MSGAADDRVVTVEIRRAGSVRCGDRLEIGNAVRTVTAVQAGTGWVYGAEQKYVCLDFAPRGRQPFSSKTLHPDEEVIVHA